MTAYFFHQFLLICTRNIARKAYIMRHSFVPKRMSRTRSGKPVVPALRRRKKCRACSHASRATRNEPAEQDNPDPFTISLAIFSYSMLSVVFPPRLSDDEVARRRRPNCVPSQWITPMRAATGQQRRSGRRHFGPLSRFRGTRLRIRTWHTVRCDPLSTETVHCRLGPGRCRCGYRPFVHALADRP